MRNILKYFALFVSSLCLGGGAYAQDILPQSRFSQLALSDPKMKELADELAQAIEESPQIIDDLQANAYLESIGKRLVRHSPNKEEDFQFYLLNDSEVNAFAGPGGIVVVNSGLIIASESESELAAVLAHEVTHVTQGHLYRGMQRSQNYRIPIIASSLAAIALGVINPALASGALAAIMTGVNHDMISFTRSNEREADRIGVRLLYESGYDPNGMVSFFNKFQNQSRYYYTDHIPAWLRTHPLDQERIADAQNRINAFPVQQYQENFDYILFRERMRVLTAVNPKRLLDYYKYEQRKRPDDIGLQYGYALTLLKSFNYDQADKIIRPLTETYPDNLMLQIALSDIDIGKNNPEQGKLRLSKLYDEYSDNYPLMYKYTDVLIDTNEASHALGILQHAVDDNPNDPLLKLQLAKAQAADKQTAAAYFSRGEALHLLGKKQQALSQFRYALKIVEPDNNKLRANINAKVAELEK